MFDAGAQNPRLDREQRARLLIGIAIKGKALAATGSPEAQPLIEPQEPDHTRTTLFPPCVNYDTGGRDDAICLFAVPNRQWVAA